MTQTPHDQLAKQYLEEFLSPLGTVQRQYEVPGETKFIDMGELEGFVQREEIMTITKAFEVWEQETEDRGRRARDIEIALNY
jgi:hypothetical protein